MELDQFKHEFPTLINPNGTPTFSLEDSLPSLPLPELSETLDLYLTSVRPFVTDKEFAATEAAVREFQASQLGRDLHARLQKRARDERNWLADWWFRLAYLTNRTPLHPLLNMAGVGPYHKQYWPPKDGTALDRAAATCRYYATVWKSLRDQTLVIDRNSSGKPMSMEQFRRFFSTCQLPGRDCDSLACHFRPRCEGPAPRHILVIARGRQFVMDLADAASDDLLPVAEYRRQLAAILKVASATPSGTSTAASSADAGVVANLLGLPRQDWAAAREHLLSLNNSNRENLDLVERAVFVLSFLDEATGDNDSRLLNLSLTSGLDTVWADKSCNLLVTRDGVWMNNCGHTPMDGMAVVSSTLHAECQIYYAQGRIEGLDEPTRLPPVPPRELRYTVDARIAADSARGRSAHAAQCASLDSAPHAFEDFGKSELRRLRLHPDTAAQLALQLAYWRAHGGRPAPTYQTATTRQFYHGRTETIRSCTQEAVAMCRAVEDWVRMGGDADAAAAAAATAVMAAHDRHNQLRTRCEAAKGCDRHLLGLQILASEQQGGQGPAAVPALFTDPAFARSGGGGNFVLSTSHLGYSTSIGCVAPMCKNGYGVFYRIGPAKIVFNMTRWTADKDTCLRRLASALDTSLRDIHRIVAASQQQQQQQLLATPVPAKL